MFSPQPHTTTSRWPLLPLLLVPALELEGSSFMAQPDRNRPITIVQARVKVRTFSIIIPPDRDFGQHRAIRQADSVRDFSSRQGLKREGILYVFQTFQTEELAEKSAEARRRNCAVLPLVYLQARWL